MNRIAAALLIAFSGAVLAQAPVATPAPVTAAASASASIQLKHLDA
jgi:hypothetical protein